MKTLIIAMVLGLMGLGAKGQVKCDSCAVSTHIWQNAKYKVLHDTLYVLGTNNHQIEKIDTIKSYLILAPHHIEFENAEIQLTCMIGYVINSNTRGFIGYLDAYKQPIARQILISIKQQQP